MEIYCVLSKTFLLGAMISTPAELKPIGIKRRRKWGDNVKGNHERNHSHFYYFIPKYILNHILAADSQGILHSVG